MIHLKTYKTKDMRKNRTSRIWLLVLVAMLGGSLPSAAQRITLPVGKSTLKTVFHRIEKATKYKFEYNSSLNVNRRVNVGKSSDDALAYVTELLRDTGFTYTLRGNYIVITPENEKRQTAPTSAHDNAPQTKRTVSGRVVDDHGEPVIGASIQIDGGGAGTVTDLDGNFTLRDVTGQTATVSYIGFKTRVVNLSSRQALKIVLQEDNKTLNEVVVVGYGTQKKANLTGAVSSVSVEDMGNRPITNSSMLLQGTASGVYALQNSGQPGADGATVNIRGVGTLNNSAPLVIIDGFPGSMSDVDASEIQSVSVLKDAASASIYGNRAANGVILITTKKGAAGKANVTYTGYWGVQQATRLPKTLNSYEYATLYNEARANEGAAPKYSDEDIQKYKDGSDPLYPDNDYFDIYYHSAQMQNHRVNVSGGSDNFQYAVMFGTLDQDGILKTTHYAKSDFRANLDSWFLKKTLRVTTRLSGYYGKQKQPSDLWSTIWYATNAPVFPFQAKDGTYYTLNGERNYLGEAETGSTRIDKTHSFNGQIEAEYKFLNGFSAQLTYGYNYLQNDRNAFNANVTLENLDGSTKTLASNLTERNTTDTQTLLTALLRYNHTFGKHTVGAMAGYSEEYFEYKWLEAYRSGFVNNSQREINLGDASSQTNNSDHYDLGLRSWFGRINYNYDNKYLFEANIRRDGSSRFADGHKWGTFPSFSAGWVMTEEPFMKGTRRVLDMLKLRASWGKLGNQNINSYYMSDVLNTGYNYSFGGTLSSGVAVNSLINKNTTWETTTQTDFGIDLNFSNGIYATMDYFHKLTDDILMQTPIPWTMGGLAAPYVNVGKVKNDGVELTLGYQKKFANGLMLKTSANLSHIINKVTDLHGASPIINSPKAVVEGYAINSFYGYVQDGIYQINDFTWQNNSDPSIPYAKRQYQLKEGVARVTDFNPVPGDIKYKDLDDDGIVDQTHDRKVIGKQFPDLSYAWSLNLSWKNFDFGMFWQGVQGIEGYTYYEIATCFSGFSNMGHWWLDRWTPENPGNTYPRVTTDGTRNNIHSTFYMEDASYLRLKNLELGYTFDKTLLAWLGGCQVRLYGNVQNLFTITSYKGFDPEQETGQTRAEAYPQTRVYTIGLSVKF